MSILFESENGWIISHLDYLHNIYKIVKDEHKDKALKFNESFFKINSQYLRQNAIPNHKKNKDNINSLNKRKRKKSTKLSEDILKEVFYFIYNILQLI
jgi:hypothetical protein